MKLWLTFFFVKKLIKLFFFSPLNVGCARLMSYKDWREREEFFFFFVI